MPRPPRFLRLAALALLVAAAGEARAQPTAPQAPAPAPSPPLVPPAKPERDVPLPGEGGPVLGLGDALARFRRESLSLQAARYGVEAARADVVAAGVLTNPNLNVNGTFLLWGAPTGASQAYGIVVDQVIPIGGQVGLRRDVARGYATAAERDFAATAWSLASDVREAYLGVQAAQAHYRALAAGMADLDRAEAIVAQRTAAGANPQYDLTRVQVERSDVTARIAEATVNLATARNRLALAVGRGLDPARLVVEDMVPEAPDAPDDVDALVVRALRQRADLGAALARQAASETKIAETRREYVPSPDVSIGYQPWFGVQGADPSHGGALYAGVTIPLPIFDHGQGKIERAGAEARQAQAQAQATELSVRLDVVKAVTAMRARVAAWRSYRDATKGQVERLRQMAEAAYREGKSGILELLDAYREYLDAREREIDLRAGAWQATLELERALGPVGPVGPNER